MVKTKIFRKRRTFTSRTQKSRPKRSKSFEITLRDGVKEFDPAKKLLNTKIIGAAIVQCLIDNDPEGVMDIIEGHIQCLNKSKFLKEANVPRSTMYQLFKKKNPTIKTLAKIMHTAHSSS